MTQALIVARGLAIVIAVLGVIDPTVTAMRRGKPEVAVISLDRSDSALARRTVDALDDDFAVVRGEYPSAAATVIVGDRLPARLPASRAYRVHEKAKRALVSLAVPRTSTTEARIPVEVGWTGGFNESATAELIVDEVVVDRAHVISSSGYGGARLTFTPTRAGPLLVTTRVIAEGDTLVAQAVTEVVDRARPVLFFDRRPSWMSTFVRRSLEQDRRFAVASRVITSRGISTEAGQAPSTLADPSVLELYDVIVVGAPASLTAPDVSGLEAFLRRRGGAVVLLFDERPPGSPVDRLTGASAWGGATTPSPVPVSAGDTSRAIMLTEAAWPVSLPAEARAELTARVGAAPRPLLWSRPVGIGQLIVNGALDAWKFRDPATSRFDEFWRATISRAAREAQAAVAVEVSAAAAEPGDEITVRVIVRDSAASANAELVSDSSATTIRLYPAAGRGEYEGRIVPATVGRYAVRATAGGSTGEAGLIVAEQVDRVHGGDGDAIETLVRTSGGVSGSVDDVADGIRSRVIAEPRREPWRPMRSGWWIVPFAGLLGLEWMARRRRGLA